MAVVVPVVDKRRRLYILSKADPWHDFGTLFRTWVMANQDHFKNGLPNHFYQTNDPPISENKTLELVIVPYGYAAPPDPPNHPVDFSRIFEVFTYMATANAFINLAVNFGPNRVALNHYMLKINDACKNTGHRSTSSDDPALTQHTNTNCVYYKKTDVVGVLDSLQEKLAIGTGEIQFSNFDGERYTVKALNSHIYSHKIPGTINRTIHRYTQKHLINAYEFLNFFNFFKINI